MIYTLEFWSLSSCIWLLVTVYRAWVSSVALLYSVVCFCVVVNLWVTSYYILVVCCLLFRFSFHPSLSSLTQLSPLPWLPHMAKSTVFLLSLSQCHQPPWHEDDILNIFSHRINFPSLPSDQLHGPVTVLGIIYWVFIIYHYLWSISVFKLI